MLVEPTWIRHHHNVAFVSSIGVGKTFLVCALARLAIRHDYVALYLRALRIF